MTRQEQRTDPDDTQDGGLRYNEEQMFSRNVKTECCVDASQHLGWHGGGKQVFNRRSLVKARFDAEFEKCSV